VSAEEPITPSKLSAQRVHIICGYVHTAIFDGLSSASLFYCIMRMLTFSASYDALREVLVILGHLHLVLLLKSFLGDPNTVLNLQGVKKKRHTNGARTELSMNGQRMLSSFDVELLVKPQSSACVNTMVCVM
jgi:hypothetical protein